MNMQENPTLTNSVAPSRRGLLALAADPALVLGRDKPSVLANKERHESHRSLSSPLRRPLGVRRQSAARAASTWDDDDRRAGARALDARRGVQRARVGPLRREERRV